MAGYRDLRVWQDAIKFVAAVYRCTETFASREQFGLTSQIRRAAVSIAANIAEGHARSSKRDYLPFVSISLGSLAETETHLTAARELGFLSADGERSLLSHSGSVGRMLQALRTALKKKPRRADPNPTEQEHGF